MTGTTKKIVLLGAALGVIAGGVVFFLFSVVLVNGPHMIRQPHLRTFEMAVPLPPEGSLPTGKVFSASRGEPTSLPKNNPVAASPENRERGQVYYGYYCIYCHGEDGRGNGPVGQSYMPKPADLTSAEIQDLPDLKLRRALLTGTGHAPVLARVVPPKYLWYLVTYVRSLGK